MKSAANKKSVVVVTGANRGIGFEICRQLAARNAEVVLTARSRAKGDEAIRKLADSGLQVSSVPLDVTKARSVTGLREFLDERFKRLDVLINNAGIIDGDDASGLEVSLDAVRRTLETNTLAPLALAQGRRASGLGLYSSIRSPRFRGYRPGSLLIEYLLALNDIAISFCRNKSGQSNPGNSVGGAYSHHIRIWYFSDA